MLEVELKFVADGRAPLEQLTAATTLGHAALGRPHSYDELDRYLDTGDLRLASVRWACRLRTRRGETIVSLKGPAETARGTDEGLHRRPELEGPATDQSDPVTWPPSAARDRLVEMTDRQPLVERLALAQRRTERDVDDGGTTVATLSLDHVRVLHHGEQRGELWSVELEQRGDAAADLERLAAALNAVAGLRPDPLTKLEHALRLVAEAAAT